MIDENSFVKATHGRPPGTMLAGSATRNGVQGDWKNYFTRRDGEIFLEITGTLLSEIGYERNTEWIENLPKQLIL